MTRLPTPLRPLFPVVKRGIVLTTEIVGPVTRRLSGTAERPGPPTHRVSTAAEYATRHPESGVVVTEVFPAIQLDRSLPQGLPAGHYAFQTKLSTEVPAAVVARIPSGRAVGHHGAVITSDDTLLFDLSPYFGVVRPSQHPLYLSPRLPAVQNIDGSVAVLTTRGGDTYYHFLLDVLPRLELLRRAGASPDHYLVNHHLPFQRELLESFGVPVERTVQSVDLPHLRADELLVPSLPDSALRTPAWVTHLLRDWLLPAEGPKPSRRLYVGRGSRRNTRRLRNEAEVLEELKPLGFEVLDPGSMSVADQVRSFAEAELVVGPHGSALTNTVFCPDGAGVVELFAPDYVNVCYWALAEAHGGLRYRYLVGDGRARRRRTMYGVASDIEVDPQAVYGLATDLLDGSGREELSLGVESPPPAP